MSKSLIITQSVAVVIVSLCQSTIGVIMLSPATILKSTLIDKIDSLVAAVAKFFVMKMLPEHI